MESCRLAEYLFARAMPVPECGCWIWLGYVETSGYGRLTIERVRDFAHRWMWRAYRGDPGDGFVLHRCDIKVCISPEHLFLGDHAANMADKAAKGRCADRRGELHPRHKITEADIHEMFAMRRRGALQQDIADTFGISGGHASTLLSGKSWKHLTIPLKTGVMPS